MIVFHPSSRFRVTSPTPRRAGRDTPRPDSTHANSVCAGPGGGGHSYDRCDELFDSFHSCAVGIKPPRPAGTPPLDEELCSATGRESAAIFVVKGNLNHPGPTTHENCIFAGPGIGYPSAEGNFIPRRYGGSSRHILTQMGT